MADHQAAAPASQPQPAELAALQVGLADTPAGQRLAIQLTILLDAAQAKATAAKIADIAASMSTTRLVVANGAMTSPQVSGMVQNGQSPSK